MHRIRVGVTERLSRGKCLQSRAIYCDASEFERGPSDKHPDIFHMPAMEDCLVEHKPKGYPLTD